MRPPDMEPPEGYHMFNPIKDPEVFGDAWESGYKTGRRMSVDAVRAMFEDMRGGPRAPRNSYEYWRIWGMYAAVGAKEVHKNAKSEEDRA